jgi:hypothetical protein
MFLQTSPTMCLYVKIGKGLQALGFVLMLVALEDEMMTIFIYCMPHCFGLLLLEKQKSMYN